MIIRLRAYAGSTAILSRIFLHSTRRASTRGRNKCRRQKREGRKKLERVFYWDFLGLSCLLANLLQLQFEFSTLSGSRDSSRCSRVLYRGSLLQNHCYDIDAPKHEHTCMCNKAWSWSFYFRHLTIVIFGEKAQKTGRPTWTTQPWLGRWIFRTFSLPGWSNIDFSPIFFISRNDEEQTRKKSLQHAKKIN